MIVHGTCTDIIFIDKKVQCIVNLNIAPHRINIPSYYLKLCQSGTLDIKVTLNRSSVMYFLKLETIHFSKSLSEMVFDYDGNYNLLRKGVPLGNVLKVTFCKSIFPKLRDILDFELTRIAVLNRTKALTDMNIK